MSIGICQWQDHHTEYPLKNAGKIGGVFSDASFVMYDGFVPSLLNINAAEPSLSLAFQLDDGVQVFTSAASGIVEGSILKLKSNGRTYGTVVFGSGIADI